MSKSSNSGGSNSPSLTIPNLTIKVDGASIDVSASDITITNATSTRTLRSVGQTFSLQSKTSSIQIGSGGITITGRGGQASNGVNNTMPNERLGRISVHELQVHTLWYQPRRFHAQVSSEHSEFIGFSRFTAMLDWCRAQWGDQDKGWRSYRKTWVMDARGRLAVARASMLVDFKMRWGGVLDP